MRYFEKISYNIFSKEVSDNRKLYDSIELPKRSTKKSAGYDIKSVENVIINPNEAKTINTGIKVCMNEDEVLEIFSRSSFGYKYNTCLANSVGIIDSDYYNNKENEGHIRVRLINLGDKPLEINIGDRIAQGIFKKYLIVDNEEEIKESRTGGIGSTGK